MKSQMTLETALVTIKWTPKESLMIASLCGWQILPDDTTSFPMVSPSLRRSRAKHSVLFYWQVSSIPLMPIIPTLPASLSFKGLKNFLVTPKTLKTLDLASNCPSLNNTHPSSQLHFPLSGSSSLGKWPYSVLLVALIICSVKVWESYRGPVSDAGNIPENLTNSHCPVPCKTVSIIFY